MHKPLEIAVKWKEGATPKEIGEAQEFIGLLSDNMNDTMPECVESIEINRI
jgi:hypothetical protein